jgi:hypothetical protein
VNVRPVPISAPVVRRSREPERGNPEESGEVPKKKMIWGSAEEKKKWEGSEEKRSN